METIHKTLNVYSFDELSKDAQEKAICDHIQFEMETMDEDSPYWHCAVKMEKMRTPWFLGETIYEDHKQDIIETIKTSSYQFLKDGEFYSDN